MKFTIKEFSERYPNDDACLDELFNARYGNDSITCEKCQKASRFYRIKTKKVYGCQYCGFQLSPTAGTIFHKSPTSLRSWFYVIYLFAMAKNGVSAKEVERQLGVTYKCAHRIAKQVRKLFDEDGDPLSGIVEVDETYVGGKATGKRGRGAENKTPVIGVVQRGSVVRAKVTTNTSRATVTPFVRTHVEIGSQVITDEYLSYNGLKKEGYYHDTVSHSQKEFVRGVTHTNTIEGFWSQLKRSINGTYHSVSPKYLQSYVNEFSYRYNYRFLNSPLFDQLISRVVPLS